MGRAAPTLIGALSRARLPPPLRRCRRRWLQRRLPRGPLLRLAARSLETRTDHEEDTGAPWLSRRVLDRPRPESTCDRSMRVAASGERCARTGPPIRIHTGRFPSGQRGQTVNLMALPSQVRILFSPPPPPHGGGPMEHASQQAAERPQGPSVRLTSATPGSDRGSDRSRVQARPTAAFPRRLPPERDAAPEAERGAPSESGGRL